MFVTFYLRSNHRRVAPSFSPFCPSSPFTSPPPPLVVSDVPLKEISISRMSLCTNWRKHTSVVARRDRGQKSDRRLQLDTSDFYYFYPHKVKERAVRKLKCILMIRPLLYIYISNYNIYICKNKMHCGDEGENSKATPLLWRVNI